MPSKSSELTAMHSGTFSPNDMYDFSIWLKVLNSACLPPAFWKLLLLSR